MSDEDHVLLNDSYFGSDMKNDDDIIEVIYRDLNRAQVNTLRLLKKIYCIEFYYPHGRYCSSCIVRIDDQFSSLRAVWKHDRRMYNSRRTFLFEM